MPSSAFSPRIRRLMVANRSEIAIRVFRAATELGITTIAIYAEEDGLSLHRFKADEAYLVGRGATGELSLGPLEAYLSIDEVIRVAKDANVDAIHPGYGFLSESPEFAEACAANGITFIGPSPDTMRALGNKVSARELAVKAGIPVMPASPPLSQDPEEIKKQAEQIGYPVMLKASWGGGGRGMRPIQSPDQLIDAVASARREAKAAFGNEEVYIEKLVQRARHVEAQILGDTHGTLVHLFERDCSIQRRNQKIIERAPAPYLDEKTRTALCASALAIGRAADYVGAGTVEFLMDSDTGAFYFIEVNPRIQVEHTVTEVVTGIDIVKAQIRIAEGGHIGSTEETGVPSQDGIEMKGHALQCRVTTEDPENNFIPDYGRITGYRGATGFGIRIDGGTAYSGAVVTRHYDPLLEKITAWGPTPTEAILRMSRALREYRIRGIATNLAFLENIVEHPRFRDNDYTTRFIDDVPELFHFAKRRDRATKLMTWIADVTVNQHPEVKGRIKPPAHTKQPIEPRFPAEPADGTKQRLDALGPEKFAQWMREQPKILITDTTLRDAHQSLLATRIRTRDLVTGAKAYARGLPQLFSLECWGGATFDVAMRFLNEDPWERLTEIRQVVPNILTQMLLRGSNGVGYTNYPDNVVKYFVHEAAQAGMDVFRIFDCFNWVENMRVSIDAVGAEGKLVEGTVCYTGDMLDPARPKYDLKYYVAMAKELEKAGCHILGVKDMAGLLKPPAAKVLFKALREEISLPIHFHTHDTSGLAAATVLTAVEAGVDTVDAATDAMSGNTSQPCLGSIVESLRETERNPELDPHAIRLISNYWETVRQHYTAFESDLKAPASEVYLHEMPGGQFTNIKEQARSLGLDQRWHEVAEAYRAANDMFGDIVKVTPSSKVVGDMALLMVSQNLSSADVLDAGRDIAFPGSVVEMLRGELGRPAGGFPETIVKRVLKDKQPMAERPGALLDDVDLTAAREQAEKDVGRHLTDADFASWLLYPKVFTAFARTLRTYGPVSVLPTSVFFYGMSTNDEITVEIDHGKTLIIRLLAVGDLEEDGHVKVFFELNGQPRIVRVPDRSAAVTSPVHRKADEADTSHIPAPMPGLVTVVSVQTGQKVQKGDVLLALEAMKMETVISAPRAGTVDELLVKPGMQIDAKDLLLILK